MAVPDPKPTLSPDLTDEQRDTAKLLRGLAGHVYADRFRDFCRLTNGDARQDMQLRAALPLAAHALRELESTLRRTLRIPFGKSGEERERDKAAAERHKAAQEALQGIGYTQTYIGRALSALDGSEHGRLLKAATALRDLKFDENLIAEAIKALRKPRHADEIKKICVNLDLGADGETSKTWQRLARLQANAAHKRSFHVQPSVDEEFRRDLARPFQALLRDLALAFQRKYHLFLLRVDELAAEADKPKSVGEFKAEIFGALPLQKRFYETIQGPDWLDSLVKEGLLGPPVPNYDDEDAGVIRWNEWPPSYYLLRIAASDDADAHDKLVRILAGLADVEDIGVREKCFEIARTLPAAQGGALADTAVKWLKPRFFWTLHGPELYLDRLIAVGQAAAALTVARALFGVRGDEGTIATKYDQSDYGQSAFPRVEPLSKLCGLDALALFADFLEQGARGRGFIRDEPQTDLTSLTSSLPEEDQARYDIYSALVVAVRRSARTLAESDPSSMAKVLQALLARPYDIYKRIALEVAVMAPAQAPAEVAALLTDPRLCGAPWCAKAYGALAKAAFATLADGDKKRVLELVRQSPERGIERWIEYRTGIDGAEPDAEARETYRRLTLRDAVWHWRDVLPEDIREQVERIGQESGPPGSEDAAFSWEGVRDESPVSAADIVAKPVAELVEFLKTWKPEDGERGLTVAALGMELRGAAEFKPEPFAEAADLFDGVGAHYIRRLLEGLDNQVRNGKVIAWPPVLRLIGKVLQRAKEQVPAGAATEGDDPNWSWALAAAAELIRAGLYRGNGRFPSAMRDEVWQSIDALYEAGPGALPEDFASRAKQDAYFAARATLEGAALEAAILYGWWSWEQNDNKTDAKERALPAKVRAVLDAALERKEDSDPGLWVILGRYFDVLLYLDREWVSGRSVELFGTAVSATRRSQLWEGHLLHGGLNQETAPYFADAFEQETARAGANGYDADYRGKRFAEYLVFLYEMGDIGLDSDGVLSRFLAEAPASVRENVTWAMTRDLQKPDAQLPPERRARIHRYFEARVNAAEQTADREHYKRELGMVGIWLGKATQDSIWILSQLKRMARLRLTPPHPNAIFEWMEALIPEALDEVIATIELILLDDGFDKWVFHAAMTHVVAILTAGSQSPDPDTRARAKNCANILMSLGLTHSALVDLAK